MCCICLADEDGAALRLCAAPRLPRSFADAMNRVAIGPKSGACGTAAYRRERVVISDLATDPLYEEFRDLALAHGLRSCWSTPIRAAEGAVLGTLAVYYTRRRVPKEREIAAVEMGAHIARIAIERARMDAQLQASKELFRSLIENTSDIVSIVDQNGIFRYVSPSMYRVLGFHPSEILGTAFDGLDPSGLTESRQQFQETLRRPGASKQAETRVRHKDGSWRVIETVANNQLSNPAIAGVIVTWRDITNRKRTEDELISSRARYRELIENANDVVYTHDMAWRLTSLNKAGERLTGYSRDEIVGASMEKLVAPEYHTIMHEMLDRKIGGEPRTTYDLEIMTKQGIRISVEVSTRLIFQMGQPVGAQGIGRDITERRRFETQALQSQKMEAIGRLAGGIAHDFNNLLTVIAGYSQWMLDDVPQDSPFMESASEILLAANRAALLTNQLLAFSRNQVIQPIILDLNSVVAQLDSMLRRIIGEDIEFVALTSLDLGLVRADPGQLEQVILNLVVNARDAMPGGGKLSLQTANVEIDEESARFELDCSPGAYVMLAVSDSGGGIDESVKPHIFEPFFTTKEIGKGTGLGLSTVYGIIKQGGGFIQVDSQPGAGAVFRIYFPRVAAGVLASGIPQRRLRVGGAEVILLVEDEPAVRRIARGMLLSLGYSVLEAPNALEAQKIVSEYEKPIQLLLTDVVMPGLGGRALATKLKAVRGDLKVLYMSGYSDDAIVQQGVLEPDTAYLQKPFNLDELAAKVRELLDG